MANEFAVFSRFRGVLANSSEPVALVVLRGEKIEVYGVTGTRKNRLASVFDSPTLDRHMDSASPLSSIFASAYGGPKVFPISDQYNWLLDQTKERMIGKPIKMNLKK